MEELIKLCNILFFIGCLVTVKAQGNICDCSPCLNGGTCEEEISGSNPFTCYCQPGYTGEICETEESTGNICDCSPCLNGGTCEEEISGSNPFTCYCLPGYTGEICETEESTGTALTCESNPCMHGGTCSQDEILGYMCHCDPNFTGLFCETPYDGTGSGCESSPCMHAGTCFPDANNGYTCSCDPNYSGFDCAIPIGGTSSGCDSDPCLGQGSCSADSFGDYECTCYTPYFGRNCEHNGEELGGEDPCSKIHCENGGTCSSFEDFPYSTCDCDWEHHYGAYCQYSYPSSNMCTSSMCMNDGTCVEMTAPPNYYCDCPTEYTGFMCETDAATGNMCTSSMCMNGGTCEEIAAPPYYYCNCLPEYTGYMCETYAATGSPCDSSPCGDPESCYPITEYPYFQCAGNPCDSSPCGDPESCYPITEYPYFQCAGAGCDPITCQNGGSCSTDGIYCDCTPNFYGSYCEYSYDGAGCDPITCQNGGSCSTDGIYCDCTPNFYGSYCEYSYDGAGCDPSTCQNGGSCSTDGIYCDCTPNFYGSYCEYSYDGSDSICYPDPCQNGGSCTPGAYGSYDCYCYEPYYGIYCEYNITDGVNPCDMNVCENGGTCTSMEGVHPFFSCTCDWDNYYGQFCQHSSSYSNPCDTQHPCGDTGYCSPSADPPYYHCSGPSYTPKDLEIRVEGCEKRYNMTQGETKTFRGWCEAAAADSYIPFRVIVFGIDTTKIYPLAIVISYMGTDTTVVQDVIGANTDPAEDGFFDITTELETMEITAPSPPTEECLFKDAFLFVAIYEQDNDDRKYKTKKQRISILCDFTGVDLEVTISAGTGAVNSARNDGSSTLGDLIGPNNAISVNEVPGSNSLPNLGSGIFVIAYITKRPVDNNVMCTEPSESSDMEFNDTLIFYRLFKHVNELSDFGTDLKSKTLKAPNHCGESTMVIQVDAVHSIPEEKKCNNYVTLSIYLEGCDANMPVPRCSVIPNPYGIGQETALTFQHTHFTPGIPGINDYRMYKFGENGSWRQEMLEPGYDDDWYTAINDIRNNKVGNARLKLLKAYVGSKTDTRLTCPTSETDAKAKVMEMEDLNPDESLVPETVENIAILLPQYSEAFAMFDSASFPLTSAQLDTKLMDLSNAFSDPTLTSAQKVDNGAASGVYSAMLNISGTFGNDEAEAVLKAGARYNVCSTGDLLIGYKYMSMYSSGDGMGADSYYAMYKRTYITQIAKHLAFMKYFFDDAPFYNCLQKTFELFLRHAVGQINGTAWLMDPCTSKPNNCLMKAKDFCRSRSDTCAETTNFVESGVMDETLCEMMNLKDFIGLEEFPLLDIAKRMKENHEYRIQQDTSGGMSMMTNDEDGTVMVGKPNALKGTICWNPEAVCTCEECIPAASTSGSDAGSSDAGMTKRRKK